MNIEHIYCPNFYSELFVKGTINYLMYRLTMK
jgi:hypothetical protein